MIKKISNKTANKIINKRKPLGLFYTVEDKKYIAIDNSGGNVWTEEFNNLKNCKKYLNGVGVNEVRNT